MKRISLLLTMFAVYCLSINAMPALIQVAEGADVIENAVINATEGDTIELITSGGDYPQGEFTINKDIIIRAGVWLAEKPIITAEGTSKAIFKIDDSSVLVLKGLEMTGGKYAVRCTSKDLLATASVKVDDCYAHNFAERFLMIDASSTEASGMDSVIIRNSVFSDITKESIVFYSGSSSNAGVPMTYAEVSNCTFNNIGREAIKSQTSQVDKILIDQCTFYNCGGSSKSMLYIKDSKELTLENCLFMKNAYSSYYIGLASNYMVSNVMFYETGATKINNIDGENVSDTAYTDPLFLDAENADFTLQLSSPALTFGDQGQAVGDLRWVVEPSGFTFSPKTLSFSADVNQESVMFLSNAAWTTEVEEPWLSVDKTAGAAITEAEDLLIAATENSTFVERSAKIYGLQAGVRMDSVVVTQAGKIALEIVAQDELQYAGAGETQTVTINAGLAWTISNGGDAWISFDAASGDLGDNQVIDIIVAANTGAYRTATVTITAGTSTEEIDIKQLRAPLTPEWTYYDCSVLPSVFSASFELDDDDNGLSLMEVVDNDKLRFAVSKDGKDVYERFDFAGDTDFDTYDGFTLMAKIQGLDSSRVIEFELKGGEYREKLKIEEFAIYADKGKNILDPSSNALAYPEGIDIMNEPVVFRFAYQRGTTKIWINEVYLGTYVSTTTDGKGNLFGFGDSSDGESYGVDMDWMLWDLTGAYGPTEGAVLPAELQISTRINESQVEEILVLYPNPSNGSFIVTNKAGANLEIFNFSGQMVFSKNNISTNEHISLDAEAGIYFVKVNDAVNKLIIE